MEELGVKFQNRTDKHKHKADLKLRQQLKGHRQECPLDFGHSESIQKIAEFSYVGLVLPNKHCVATGRAQFFIYPWFIFFG